MKKYTPTNPQPDDKNPDNYLNLSYCLFDFAKQKISESDERFSDLEAEYIVTPCFPQSQKDKEHFKPYTLYTETIEGRNSLKGETQGNEILNGESVFVRAEIGLLASKDNTLDLIGIKYTVNIESSELKENKEDEREVLSDGMTITLKPAEEQSKSAEEKGEA